MNREDAYYEALCARDPRFDGKFFVGVKTTGIYCRPICPARPLRKNVLFFSSPLDAERSGFRPCLRCRPESAPRSAAWVGTSAVVQRAVRQLQNGDHTDFDETTFAARFGVTPRHLRRLFVAELGKTPNQIVMESRLNLARKLIVETELPLSQVAFGAGFSSIRRFNDAFKERFKKSPSQIRRMPLARSSGLTVSLPYRPPFHFESLLASYRVHRIGELEQISETNLRRFVRLGEKEGWITISNDPEKTRLLVEVDFPDYTYLPQILARVRTMFDLDCDPLIIAAKFADEPSLRKLAQKHDGLRLPSGWDPFEIAIATILGQLVSVERGRSLVNDLMAGLGEKSRWLHNGKPLTLFPTAAQIAASDLAWLKTTGMRKKTLVAFSRAIASGDLSLEPTQDVEAFVQKVQGLPGIGPWSAHYMALKALRHADAFPASDLILKRAVARHSKEGVERLSPWRGYVAVLFWREYAQTLSKARKSS